MSTKTDLLLRAFKLIEEMPQSFVHPKDWEKSDDRRQLIRRTVGVIGFLQGWAASVGRITYELYFTSRFSPALIITKAVVENSAIAFGVMEQIWQTNKRGKVAEFEEGINALIRKTRGGNQTVAGGENAFLYQCINKKFATFQSDYDHLTRLVDPLAEVWRTGNSPDEGDSAVEPPSLIGLKNFLGALMVFNHSFTQCGAGLPSLVRLFTGRVKTK